jgi:5-methylcytosine-specific restriction enzyme subunit McrC
VGLVAIPSLELHVAPKISLRHFVTLLQANILTPRFDVGLGHLAEDDNLAVVIANWYMTALERVLEQGLSADYEERREEIRSVRGRVSPIDTARLYYRGRLTVVADFEEFAVDTPLNRLLAHAARIIASAQPLPGSLRRRATRSLARMDGVGELHPDDLQTATPERRNTYYRDASLLAREVVRATGRTLSPGGHRSWTFLLRTPGLVEAGVREILKVGLEPIEVKKQRVELKGTAMSVNPDLVFGSGIQTADIKYKVGGGEWNRADLYEVVAFMAALNAEAGAIVTFRRSGSEGLPDVVFGDLPVRELSWRFGDDVSPEVAIAELISQTESWLEETTPTTLTEPGY